MDDITPALIPAVLFVGTGIYIVKQARKEFKKDDEAILKALRIKQEGNLQGQSGNEAPATTLNRDRK